MGAREVSVPGPTGLPLLGSVRELRRDSLGAFLAAQREFGDLCRFVAGPPGLRNEVYAVFSATGAQQVLATDSANFRKDNLFYQEVRESFGNGLLTSQDADYLRQRRLVQPLFTRRRVDGYARAMTIEAAALIGRWSDSPDATVDLVPDMADLALRTVARILFGTDVGRAVAVVERCFPILGEYVLRRGFSPANPPRAWPTPANRRAAAATEELYAVCDAIIAGRVVNGRTQESAPKSTREQTCDLLTLLTQAQSEQEEAFGPAELREQVLVFLLAGHETTATSMAFALHLLAGHPKEQELARQEVESVLAGRVPTAADLDRLPYLTQVLKESMRLYPAAPIIGRRSVEAREIGGMTVPAESDVMVAPWVIHRNPAYWPEPERFRPDRFTSQAEQDRPRYAWLPFGGGPRACIGQHFSMLESTLALAMILQSFELEAVDREVPVETGITLRAKGPARARLRKLDGNGA
ncbi:cytochrome P450 [Streptomyces sp. NPDC006879]|uniref:cytochrome P450 n=1 Tax=Streptomyces sp. NPDC006879 TaxID=3364767 RepID=UPI0036BEAFD1